jgi:hypothetical protein
LTQVPSPRTIQPETVPTSAQKVTSLPLPSKMVPSAHWYWAWPHCDSGSLGSVSFQTPLGMSGMLIWSRSRLKEKCAGVPTWLCIDGESLSDPGFEGLPQPSPIGCTCPWGRWLSSPSVFSLTGKSGSSSQEGCVMTHLAVWEQKPTQ